MATCRPTGLTPPHRQLLSAPAHTKSPFVQESPRFISDQDLGMAQDLSGIASGHVAVGYGDRSRLMSVSVSPVLTGPKIPLRTRSASCSFLKS